VRLELILPEMSCFQDLTPFNSMLTERTIFSLCEVLPNTTLQVRLSDQIVDGEAVKASTFRRYCLAPGSDLTGQPEQVVAIANAVWTPAAITAYNANLQPTIQ
jgi:hypothetical protein